MSLIPLRNEPNDIQRPSPSVLITAGSIALKLSLLTDWITIPWSIHSYCGSVGSSVALEARAMAEVFTPNRDTE